MNLLEILGGALIGCAGGAITADLMVGIRRWREVRAPSRKGPRTMPTEWPGVTEAAPYVWTGGAGITGRLMYHSHQVQRGKRKPLSWALCCDVPIAIGMGWLTLGLCDWLSLAPQPTISLAIAAGHLGPYSIDRAFAALAERYFKPITPPSAKQGE